jgi:hypothetical protein
LVCPLITKGLRSIRGYTFAASYLQSWQQDISFSKFTPLQQAFIGKQRRDFCVFFGGRERRFLVNITLECKELLLLFFILFIYYLFFVKFERKRRKFVVGYKERAKKMKERSTKIRCLIKGLNDGK